MTWNSQHASRKITALKRTRKNKFKNYPRCQGDTPLLPSLSLSVDTRMQTPISRIGRSNLARAVRPTLWNTARVSARPFAAFAAAGRKYGAGAPLRRGVSLAGRRVRPALASLLFSSRRANVAPHCAT